MMRRSRRSGKERLREPQYNLAAPELKCVILNLFKGPRCVTAENEHPMENGTSTTRVSQGLEGVREFSE